MYIKKVTKSIKTSSKKKYTYLHLVENIRTDKGPRQRLILNLGTLNIAPEDYKELANCIDGMLNGQKNLFSPDTNIVKHATCAVSKILEKNTNTIDTASASSETSIEAVEVKPIDINSITVSKSRSIGAEYVCHHFFEKLQIKKCLENANIPQNQIPIIEAIILGRLISPGSERHTKKWADERSAIYELAKHPLKHSLSSFYRAANNLYSCKKSLERGLNNRERELFSLTESMCFFDLTNTFLEGEAKRNPKAAHGHSKEKRSDCKLLTLALIVDEQGFAKYSHLYPGNQYEGHTLKEMIEEMVEINPALAVDRTIVMDAGIATKDNIAYLKKEKLHYIVVNKGRSPFTTDDIKDMITIREDKKSDIKIEVARQVKSDEIFILCKSAKREQKERAIRSRQEKLFLEQLEKIKSGLNKKGSVKLYQKIVEKVGKLRQKYPRASKIFEVNVISDEKSNNNKKELSAIEIIWNKKKMIPDAQAMDGCYVLKTDRFDLTDEEIWKTYCMLTRIENSFRCMKSSLGIRPVFHQKELNSDAHIFVSVIAYHILHAIEYTLSKNGDSRSWATIRDVLATHQWITMEYDEYKEDKTKTHQYRTMCTEAEPIHKEIYQILGVSSIPSKKKVFKDM